MNKLLIEKLLGKLTLNDLYEEVKGSDQVIFHIGMMLAKKNPAVFVDLIRKFVEQHVNNQADAKMRKFLRDEIIDMDGVNDVSINSAAKRKVVSSATPVQASSSALYDPCSRGGGGRVSGC
jgi:hypothetical protein